MSAPPDLALGEPYEHALTHATGPLVLHDLARPRRLRLDVARFLSAPDDVDTGLARELPGPVLDIGCGPGRMLRAALDAGHAALGVDVSRAAVAIAHDRGLPVVHRSVFDRLPAEGEWGAVLLLDGNIGIGGDPAALVLRCAGLLRTAGRLVVETHPSARRDRRFHGVLHGPGGGAGAPFPWAEVGRLALRRHAAVAGLGLMREWRSGARRFSEYVALASVSAAASAVISG